MASTIAAVTTSGGGVVTTADASGNLNLVSGTTTVVAVTATGVAITGTTSISGALTGTSALFSPITNSLSGDVALNNTANYFDGPSVAQGTSGTWFVSGTVTLLSTGVDRFNVKLWDGTTIFATASTTNAAAGNETTVTLSGFITAPVGNIRLSVKDTISTNGTIVFNRTGNSKDSTITAIRIG